MAKAVVAGVLVFLAVLVLRAPASLVQRLLPEEIPVDVLELSGTLWRGEGDLLVNGVTLGRVSWTFRPMAMVTGVLGCDLALSGDGLALRGEVRAGASGTEADLAGWVDAAVANVWLAAYDIRLSGRFHFRETRVSAQDGAVRALSGTVTWDGGPVSYRLSGKMHNATLPGMRGELGPGPEATAYPENEATPLLRMALLDTGFVRIGVTKYLTRILGDPWPGGDPDHAIVLEVEEQVF